MYGGACTAPITPIKTFTKSFFKRDASQRRCIFFIRWNPDTVNVENWNAATDPGN